MQNVLFLLVDCLRADKCYGINSAAKTPTIDTLRLRGTAFLNAISTTSFTTPSIASLLTGVYPFTHGIRSLSGCKLNSSIGTLGEIFKEKGYNTYAEVAGPLFTELGLNKGFDTYEHRRGGYLHSDWGQSLTQKFKHNEFKEPFFLFVHFFDLHGPRRIKRSFNTKDFGRNKYERALSCFDVGLGELLNYVNYSNTVIVFHADHGEKIAETKLGEYYNKQSHKLLSIYGKMYHSFRFLRELTKNRPVNRPEGHGFHLYDFLVKVPLIFVGEGIFPENKVIPDMVRQVDILPTIVDALGLNGNSNMKIHGRSLMPLIKGEEFKEIPAYCEACGGFIADKRRWLVGIRTSRYKYIYAPHNENLRPELYNLEEDPEEKKNIVNEKTEIAQNLKQELVNIQSEDLGIRPTIERLSEREETIMKERLRKLGYI